MNRKHGGPEVSPHLQRGSEGRRQGGGDRGGEMDRERLREKRMCPGVTEQEIEGTREGSITSSQAGDSPSIAPRQGSGQPLFPPLHSSP
jgi:hypothetical protein